MSVKLLKENHKQDRAIWDGILKSVAGDLATGPISQDYGLGHRIVDIYADDETINKVADRAKSAGFKEVHRQIEDDPRSDSYVVFTRESNGQRVVLGIVFNASENFAYVDCGYDPNSPDDAEWFEESLIEDSSLVSKSVSTLKKMLKTATPEESKKIWAELNCRGVYARGKGPKNLEESPNRVPYTWSGDWQSEYGAPCKVKYYCKGQDFTGQVIGIVYQPDGKEFTDYGAEIYDNDSAQSIETKDFDTEQEAKSWVEDWFSRTEKLDEDAPRDRNDMIFTLKKLRTEASDALHYYEDKDSLVECRDSLYYLVNDARSALDQVNMMIKDRKLERLVRGESVDVSDDDKLYLIHFVNSSDSSQETTIKAPSKDLAIRALKKKLGKEIRLINSVNEIKSRQSAKSSTSPLQSPSQRWEVENGLVHIYIDDCLVGIFPDKESARDAGYLVD